jgi:serine/threonine protein kinase
MLSALSLWLAYARALVSTPAYEKRSPYFHSRVFRVPSRRGTLAVKVVRSDDPNASALLFREHTFLQALSHPNVVRYRGHLRIGRRYVLVTDWIDGQAIDAPAQEISNLVEVLRRAGIRHRDIREKNMFVSSTGPVLFDFGWAAWDSEQDVFTPPTLPPGDDERAAAAMLQRLTAATGRQIA